MEWTFIISPLLKRLLWTLSIAEVLDYLKEQKAYLRELLKKFCSMVDEQAREHLDGYRFLD